MSKLFTRLMTIEVKGEIYDLETKPEEILKNYLWSYRDNADDNIHLIAKHRDKRGRINSVRVLSEIKKPKKPDTEYFLI